jgi:hypothetical protein
MKDIEWDLMNFDKIKKWQYYLVHNNFEFFKAQSLKEYENNNQISDN